ncbi:glycosyl transferase [Ligilactobacillus pabuli]|uniref:Peptide O-xylosyltransferase n=1 Tax=Ligilactobacillus pabuli TaxID=2886039 RepID=A0ABQ5JP19_9LACO|nr:beta-1,6-N-acetylglucosaminyltransferase [Ligilactobacillus pabuli]GKS82320.1 glycosyl transferase [Ligilactobacillus pabuli]
MKKHAFLIMATKNNEQLRKLIETLDDPQNDIFLHIDSDFRGTVNCNVKSSPVYVVDRIKGSWAAYSLVKIEFALLKKAVEVGGYSYFHLLSESDLPIVSNDELHSFFFNRAEEFIEFQEINTKAIKNKVNYIYPLQEYIGKKHGALWFLQKLILILEKLFSKKNQDEMYQNLAKGSQWFSITEDFAEYIVDQEEKCEKLLSKSQAPDEIFIQTICLNSKFVNRISNVEEGNLRYIKWNKGNSPEILMGKDITKIVGSGDIFARKFNGEVDYGVMKEIYNMIGKK